MKRFTILIPIYNDWKSLEKLLFNINENIKNIPNTRFNCVIINDCSRIKNPEIQNLSNINSIKIIHMLENRGHARCNAFGIKHLSKSIDLDYLILMDGDGEDRPEEIKLLVEKITSENEKSVVAKRFKRSEGFLFQLLYKLHKILTFIFTGKNINFGNYCCLTKRDTEILHFEPSLWSSFSGSVKKHIKNYSEIKSNRGTRYFGPSKMSLIKLIIHSFGIIAVFKNIVFLRSAILIFAISYFSHNFGFTVIFCQLFLVIFNLLIFLVSLRESQKELLNSHKNEMSIFLIKH